MNQNQLLVNSKVRNSFPRRNIFRMFGGGVALFVCDRFHVLCLLDPRHFMLLGNRPRF